MDDDEPIFQIAAGLNEPAARPAGDAAAKSEQPRTNSSNTELDDGREEPTIEIEGTSRTGRPRKPTFRYSPGADQPNRRRRDKTTTPDEKKGAASASADGDFDALAEGEEEDADDHEVDPDETSRGAGAKRTRRQAAGAKPTRRGQDAEKQEGTARERLAAGTAAGRGRGRGRGRGTSAKRARNSEKEQDADPVEGKADRATDELPATREWSSGDDRRWDKDIMRLRALFSDFCKKEDEAKAVCSEIQALLTRWTEKAAPSTEVLTHTMAGKYLKSHIIRRAQEGSLLDATYPRSVLNKWKREVAGPKLPAAPADPQAAPERGAPAARADVAKVQAASPKAPPSGTPGDSGATAAAAAAPPPAADAPTEPKAKRSRAEGDAKPPAAGPGSTGGQTPGSAKADRPASKPTDLSTQLLAASDSLEAREPQVRNFKVDGYRGKGLAIVAEALQSEVPHTQVAVLLEELLHQSCLQQGAPSEIEYKQGLFKMWNHLACGGEAYNPRLREALVSGRLKAVDLLQMGVEDMKHYGLSGAHGAGTKIKPQTS